jgi:perosamine synthetase
MIPLLKPSCSELEIRYITETLRSGWWGMGQKVEEFEGKFAELVGVKYAVAVNSATSALDLAIKAHGITDGEIIVPALTFVSTALAGIYNGCKIVFADIDEDTLCIDWTDVSKKITKDTKAIIPVWYGGLVPYRPSWTWTLDPIVLIEDCSHAAGNPLAGKNNTACWSFHAVKNIATGDGGMVTTNNEKIKNKLNLLRWCGIDRSTWERVQKRYGWDYTIDTVGYKCHMNDLTASLGLAQLERLTELNEKRKLIALTYRDQLKDISGLQLPAASSMSSWHLFVIRVEKRDKFIDYLLSNGISAGVHYKPLNTYPIFPHTPLPVTDRVWKSLVSIPIYPDMTEKEQQYIIAMIKDFYDA